MSTWPLLVLALYVSSCQQPPLPLTEASLLPAVSFTTCSFKQDTWQHFLQSLPTQPGEIVDYTGSPVANQSKQAAILTYDVGHKDLQQCADALIRLRAEYLFAQQRYNNIRFRFTSGHFYAWSDYRKGIRPQVHGNQVVFANSAPASPSYTYRSLRSYLDIVYAYAGTLSLNSELLPATRFEVGTIIIKPGSPGHCCMIVDEAIIAAGKRLFKLVEGYTPAQSIYILKNPVDGSPWHELKEGEPVITASYRFTVYNLRRFE